MEQQQPEPQGPGGETTRSGTTPSAAAAAASTPSGAETQEDIPLTPPPPPPPSSTCCSPGKQQQPQPQANDNNSNEMKQQPRRSWSQPALQRRRKLQDAQRRATDRLLHHPQHPHPHDDDGASSKKNGRRAAALQRGWRAAARAVNKVNVARWIGDLERDQELADHLERVNEEHAAESERRLLVARVRAECLAAVRAHLESFLRERGLAGATYEEWIGEVHPDNVVVEPPGEDSSNNNNNNNNSSAGGPVVDARFYVPDSDHRILWNEHHPRTGDGASRRVPARAVVVEPEGRTVGNNSSSSSALSPTPTPTTENDDDSDAADNNVTSSEGVQHHPTSNPKRTDPVIELV